MKKKHKKRLIGNGLGEYGKKLFLESVKEYHKAKERLNNESQRRLCI